MKKEKGTEMKKVSNTEREFVSQFTAWVWSEASVDVYDMVLTYAMRVVGGQYKNIKTMIKEDGDDLRNITELLLRKFKKEKDKGEVITEKIIVLSEIVLIDYISQVVKSLKSFGL